MCRLRAKFLAGRQPFWKGSGLLGRGSPNEGDRYDGIPRFEIRNATRGRQLLYSYGSSVHYRRRDRSSRRTLDRHVASVFRSSVGVFFLAWLRPFLGGSWAGPRRGRKACVSKIKRFSCLSQGRSSTGRRPAIHDVHSLQRRPTVEKERKRMNCKIDYTAEPGRRKGIHARRLTNK